MNSTLNTAYLSDRVKAINSFHNAMISATSEYLSNDSYHLVGVERSDGSSLFGMVSKEKAEKFLEILKPYLPDVALRSYD